MNRADVGMLELPWKELGGNEAVEVVGDQSRLHSQPQNSTGPWASRGRVQGFSDPTFARTTTLECGRISARRVQTVQRLDRLVTASTEIDCYSWLETLGR
jgi:hypothetical protein